MPLVIRDQKGNEILRLPYLPGLVIDFKDKDKCAYAHFGRSGRAHKEPALNVYLPKGFVEYCLSNNSEELLLALIAHELCELAGGSHEEAERIEKKI